MDKKINIGVSSCLLGNEVRHDGGHKRDRYITDILSEYFDFTSFCPETAIGLGIPRPTIRLAMISNDVQLVKSDDYSIDYTQQMRTNGDSYCSQIADLSGYILKSKSPSCGMERVNLYQDNGYATKEGVGIFAQSLLQAHPYMPVEEEGRLNDAHIRENFIERVFAYHRWQKMTAGSYSISDFMDFHKQHKLILLAHNEAIYRKMGRLVAETNRENLLEQSNDYIHLFSQAMSSKATRNSHVNVLQHLMGYLKQSADAEDKAELLEVFDKYHQGELPLIVPITLLHHHFRKHPDDYISQQYYLNPYPAELMLRNHV